MFGVSDLNRVRIRGVRERNIEGENWLCRVLTCKCTRKGEAFGVERLSTENAGGGKVEI